MAVDIKADDKAIAAYYERVKVARKQEARHEGNIRRAFGNLLEETARGKKWSLVTEESVKVAGKSIRYDGVVRADFGTTRGHWEAKDEEDDLDVEIRKKRERGYSFKNIIFEDTREAVLFQDGYEVYRIDLGDADDLADLLNRFYNFQIEAYDNFEQAVAHFQDEIPHVAQDLNGKIKAAHEGNKQFQGAFTDFMELCRTSLNPNISREAVDEMLIQHLLTERLLRNVFNMTEFTQRNVIAAEIEKVIGALTSQHFNRAQFLGALDPFYKAIERAADELASFSEKQHFINTVYERFFQGYSVKIADTHGIVYTPQEIVDFMVASVAEVLETEFGQSLGDPNVHILDPATGTGNFIVNVLRYINEHDRRNLEGAYRARLFANEVMLLPYYIASLNIEHEYYEMTGHYEPFEGLCFVDTLDLAEGRQQAFSFMTEKNTERVERQKQAPITVIIGNPPYNVGQLNENDNNKNRKYEVIDGRVRETYASDSTATLKAQLYDPYVKFFRWATDRLNGNEGIVCYVSNNSFVDQIAFDGMRKHLSNDFTRIYHIDLHGNVRQNPKLSGTTHNVFGIQVGVGITVAVRSLHHQETQLLYHRMPEFWVKEEKLRFLTGNGNGTTDSILEEIEWQMLVPNSENLWLVPEHAQEFTDLIPIGSKSVKSEISDQAIHRLYSRGVTTSRDSWVHDFTTESLSHKIKKFIENYNFEVFRYSKQANPPSNISNFVNNDPTFIKWTDRLKNALGNSQTLGFDPLLIRETLYRPFTRMLLYFDPLLTHRQYQQHKILPTTYTQNENLQICVSGVGSNKDFQVLICNVIPSLDLLEKTQCFPFYVYDEDGSNRRENITDWALEEFRGHYGDDTITKWAIFYYVYGLLHHGGYRERYADSLKRELPRIPFAPEFWAFSKAGEKLADLHLNYEDMEGYQLKWEQTADRVDFRVEKMRPRAKSKSAENFTVFEALKVNDSLTLSGIPAEAFRYRLGNRSALEWVVDQYRVKTDSRSGIVHDPNTYGDERYIVDLVEKVVQVSVETVGIVEKLEGMDFREG